MNRDPFYNQIIDRLNGKLDPDTFEDCSCFLLRSVYPGLTPMRGGSDSGMDGAIGDGKQEPFPLVATTSDDVIGNFTRNLNTYVRDGGKRRHVVLATSVLQTPRKKVNLYKRAETLGFTLVNIHDQIAFANLLYQDPRWCLELLNLPSTPPPLSKIPRTERPLLIVPIKGRESSLNWLCQTPGDLIILGQPGAGKTFLLYQLAQKDDGLFLNDFEQARIAEGIRSQKPKAIFVDDAAGVRGVLPMLRHLRNEMGAQFRIIATGWPGEKETLMQALNIVETNVHNLELLTRDEIVGVIHDAGLFGSDQLIHEIVDQADGRPGLAVTLTLYCLQGAVHEVVFGEPLSSSILDFAGRFISRQAAPILAVLSLTGDAGISMNSVSQILGLSLGEVFSALHLLAASGIVWEVDYGSEQRYIVRPQVLRFALVRDVFYRNVTFPIDLVLAHVADRSQVVLTLIGAHFRGANIPIQQLQSLVINSPTDKVLEAFAWLGREETEWVLHQYPNKLATICDAGLSLAPETFLSAMLSAAVGDNRQLSSYPDHPLRRIGDWVASARPGTADILKRRALLLAALEHWLNEIGGWNIGGQALGSVLSPRFEYENVDPGEGNQVRFTFGVVSLDQLHEIETLWPRVKNILATNDIPDWSPVCGIIENWAYPERHGVTLPKENYVAIQLFAKEMLQDIIPLIGENLGTLRWARGLVLNLGWDIVVPTNGEFETLYPFWIHKEELPLFESRMKDIIIELAETWSRANPIDIAHRLSLYVAAAKAANISWPDLTVALCTELSARVSDYIIWARALIEANLTGYLIFPFLLLAANKREPDWRNVVQDCLVNPETRGSAIEVVLTLPEPPEDLVDQIWPLLDPYSSLVRFICQRRALSGDLLPALLRHTSTNISSAAAYGIWNADASHVIPAPLINDWKQAVLRSNADYWLTDVFRLNPDLAYRWLQNHIADSRSFDSPLIDIIRSIISVFTYDMRCYLLDQIPGQGNYDTLIVILIGGDLTLYKHLLGNENLRRYHLTILQSRPNGEWVEKALLAHDAGYSTDDIAHATVYGTSGMEITGPASVAWVNWMKDFELLCGHENDCIKAIGEVGVVFARRNLEESQKRERYKAVFGIGL